MQYTVENIRDALLVIGARQSILAHDPEPPGTPRGRRIRTVRRALLLAMEDLASCEAPIESSPAHR